MIVENGESMWFGGHGVPDFAASGPWQDDKFLISRKLEEVRILYFYTLFSTR